MNPVLAASKLRFSYDHRPLLNRVSLHLMPGKCLFISGPSGQGKSALLRLLLGLERPIEGRIRIFGEDINTLRQEEFNRLKTNLGFVFQNPALLANKTIWENIALPLQYHHWGTKKEISTQVDRTLEMLLITEFRNHYPASLSLGILKRAAMARAMIMSPRLLIMDEPTSGLDAISRGILLALISNIQKLNHVAILIATHDLLAARELGGLVGVLKDGELLEPMDYDQLSQCPDSYVQRLFGDKFMFTGVR